jgi:hypothetical protein
MAKIKIKDLPKSMKVSKSELKNVKGGYLRVSYSYYSAYQPLTMYPTSGLSFIGWGSADQMAGKCGCMGMPQDPAECMLAP